MQRIVHLKGWHWTDHERFGFRLLLAAVLVLLALLAWDRWRPSVVGRFAARDIRQFDESWRALMVAQGTRNGGNTPATFSLPVPEHFLAKVTIEGHDVDVWIDNRDKSFLDDGFLTIRYRRARTGVIIVKVGD